jgi:HEAT repeat protein
MALAQYKNEQFLFAQASWNVARSLQTQSEPQALNPGEEKKHIRDRTYVQGDHSQMNTINALIEELKNDDCDVRWHAARALRWTKDARAIDALMRAFKDVDCNVRWSAAESLVIIGDAAVKPLVAALRDADMDVRWRAAWALGRLKDIAAVDALLDALGDNDPDIRWRAAWALGQIGDARAVGRLMRALEDSYSNVRWSAAEALGAISDEQAVEPLVRLLNNQREETIIRLVAADSLGKIGAPQAEAALQAVILQDEFAPIHETARNALERMKKRE